MANIIIKDVEENYLSHISYTKDNTVYILASRGREGKNIESFTNESFDFYKYIKNYKDDINIELYSDSGEKNIQILHSKEIWLPILYFALHDVTLPLTINYVFDYLKHKYGKQLKEDDIIHFCAVVEDRKTGKRKEIKYDGPENVFKSNFDKIDITKIMGD